MRSTGRAAENRLTRIELSANPAASTQVPGRGLKSIAVHAKLVTASEPSAANRQEGSAAVGEQGGGGAGRGGEHLPAGRRASRTVPPVWPIATQSSSGEKAIAETVERNPLTTCVRSREQRQR